eukprot:3757044-Rhodomonas_salina.1
MSASPEDTYRKEYQCQQWYCRPCGTTLHFFVTACNRTNFTNPVRSSDSISSLIDARAVQQR